MKFQLVNVLIIAGMMSVGPSQAQTNVPKAGSTSSILPVANPSYQIAPGDLLGVTVVNAPTGFVVPSPVMVAPDGTVSLPLIHTVTLSGTTVEQATSTLTKKWKRYIIDPVVTVSLIQKHLQTVVFTGAVNRPGLLDYRPNMHLLEALAEAGGLMTVGGMTTNGTPISLSDAAHAVITHADGSRQMLDLSQPDQKAGTDIDIALVPGDVVYVPQQTGRVSVVGQVRQPGTLPYKEHMTILEAISESGGIPDLDSADLRHAKLIHNEQETPLDLYPMMRDGNMTANVVLSPGDRVFIPEFINRTYVYGDVFHTGFYAYKPGDRVLDALNGVGGNLPTADLSKINLIHTDKVKNTARLVQVNLNNFLLHGDYSGNPPVGPGDALYLPEKSHKTTLNDLLSPIIGIGAVGNGVRAFR